MDRSEHNSRRKSSDRRTGPDTQVLIHHAWAGISHGGGAQDAESVGAVEDAGLNTKGKERGERDNEDAAASFGTSVELPIRGPIVCRWKVGEERQT